jgi:hypothetical protein
MQNLHQSTWNHKILHVYRSSKDEQLFIWPLLQKEQKYKHGVQLKVKIHIIDIPMCFIRIIVFFGGAFECDQDLKFWDYGGTSAEPLCIEFYNFVQFYLSLYVSLTPIRLE